MLEHVEDTAHLLLEVRRVLRPGTVCLLAAPEGVAHLEAETSKLNVPVKVVLGSVDEKLNEKGYIVPGLGDAGDRLYGLV